MDTVFSAFPSAIISGRYSLGKHQRGTLVGNVFNKYGDLDAIVDEGQSSSIQNAPNADILTADMLMYVRPEQLPTVNVRELASSCMIYDSETADYFEIIDASIGKNQESGVIEHIQLLLRQTEAEDVESE